MWTTAVSNINSGGETASGECEGLVRKLGLPKLLFLLTLPVLASGQTTSRLYPIVERDRLGFIDSRGKEIIAAQFTGYECSFRTLPQFSEGLAPVQDGSKLGYIDQTGKFVFVLPPHFMDPHPFREGVALVRISTYLLKVPDQWAWIDRTGHLLHATVMGLPTEFHEDLMRSQTGQYWGYLDHSFQWAIPPRFQRAEDFSDGLALVSMLNGSKPEWAYIDKTGSVVFKEGSDYSTASNFAEGLARVMVTPGDGPRAHHSLVEFVDHTGHEVIPPDFAYASFAFSDGYAFASVDGRREMAVIDKSGKLLTPPDFDAFLASEFHEGLAAIRKGTVFGYIDPAGTWVIPPQYDEANNFSGGLALVVWRAKREWAYVDKRGQVVWKGIDRCQYPIP